MSNAMKSPRRGFTLIELLVVISIIAVLGSLILGAAMRIRGAGPRLEARTDITNLEGAMADFKRDFGVEYIPSDIVLREDVYTNSAAHQRAVAYLSRMFGKNIFKPHATPGYVTVNIDWNGNGSLQNTDMHLTGEECLVFFLGGIPSRTGGNKCLGFSKNAENPAAAGGVRSGPYFQFKSGRLVDGPSGTGFFAYRDPFVRPSGTFTNYAYFSASKGGTYTPYSPVANYYRDGAGQPINPNGYQIICAGQDGLFGSTPTTPGAISASGISNPNGNDDLANFGKGQLGAGIN